jgi:hypothetical protein
VVEDSGKVAVEVSACDELEGIVEVAAVAVSDAAVAVAAAVAVVVGVGAEADVDIDTDESAGAAAADEEGASTEFGFRFGFEYEFGSGIEAEIEPVAEEGAGAGVGSVTFWSRLSSLFTGDFGIAFGVCVAVAVAVDAAVDIDVAVALDGVAAGGDAVAFVVVVAVAFLFATTWCSRSVPRLSGRPLRPAMDEVIAVRATSSFVTHPHLTRGWHRRRGVSAEGAPGAGCIFEGMAVGSKDGENKRFKTDEAFAWVLQSRDV